MFEHDLDFFFLLMNVCYKVKKILAQVLQSLEQLSEKEVRFFLVHDYSFC